MISSSQVSSPCARGGVDDGALAGEECEDRRYEEDSFEVIDEEDDDDMGDGEDASESAPLMPASGATADARARIGSPDASVDADVEEILEEEEEEEDRLEHGPIDGDNNELNERRSASTVARRRLPFAAINERANSAKQRAQSARSVRASSSSTSVA